MVPRQSTRGEWNWALASYWCRKDATGIQVLVHAVEEWTSWTHRQQAKSLLQESKELPGLLGGGRRAPTLYCLTGVLSLKDGGVPTWGPERCVFSHWPCPVTYISPCPIGVLEWKCPISFMISLPFSSLRLRHHSSHSFSISWGVEWVRDQGPCGHRYTFYSIQGLWGITLWSP